MTVATCALSLLVIAEHLRIARAALDELTGQAGRAALLWTRSVRPDVALEVMFHVKYDVVVIGGGHVGCEAAVARA